MTVTLTGLATSVTFDENTVNATPQLLDADVAFASTAALSGGRLVVSGLLAEDRLSVLTQGSSAGQIGVSGSTISYAGTAIGTASGGSGADFTVSFNANVTAPAVDALIQRLAFADTSNTPTATRDLTINVYDGAGVHFGGVGPLTAQTGTANPFNGLDVGFNSTPTFVDLDGDGRLDLVSGESGGTFLAWHNTGSGYTALTGSANPFNGLDVGYNSTPTFVDLDGDGRLDLVSGESGGTFLAWHNTGSGYTALTGSANPFNGIRIDFDFVSTPTFVDLDGDGRLDLVSGEHLGGFLAWHNTGSGYTASIARSTPAKLGTREDIGVSFLLHPAAVRASCLLATIAPSPSCVRGPRMQSQTSHAVAARCLQQPCADAGFGHHLKGPARQAEEILNHRASAAEIGRMLRQCPRR